MQAVVNFLASVAAQMAHHGAREVPQVGWLLPIEASKDIRFDAESDALGQRCQGQPSPYAPHELAGAVARDAGRQGDDDAGAADAPAGVAGGNGARAFRAEDELEGVERRARSVWLASTLTSRAADAHPGRVESSTGETLWCATGVLSAVLARRQSLLNTRHLNLGTHPTSACTDGREAQAAGRDDARTDVSSGATHAARQAPVGSAKPLWRGRRKRNKKQGGASLTHQGSSTTASRPEEQVLPPEQRALCSCAAPDESPGGNGTEPHKDERGADWYHNRRPKKHRLLAQARRQGTHACMLA